ncbi:hypothetical protein F4804DRAFT_316228 [Jackrogersella minutella]|nr:hypothetical protein F4804DRAFT_316228 [Jackrogersella minutella]
MCTLFSKNVKKRFVVASENFKKTPIEDILVGEGWDTIIHENVHLITDSRDWKPNIPPDSKTTLQVGIQIKKSHASVIIEELKSSDKNALTANDPFFLTSPFEELRGHIIPESSAARLLHIRYLDLDSKKMVLAFDKKGYELSCERYIRVCRVFTSWEELQCIALRNCTSVHSILVDDCVTFALDVVKELLEGYVEKEEDRKEYMGKLIQLTPIVQESAQSEASSRKLLDDRPAPKPHESKEPQVA